MPGHTRQIYWGRRVTSTRTSATWAWSISTRPTAAEGPSRRLKGTLQVDGCAGYRSLAETDTVALAFCWSHVRRRFYEIAAAGSAPNANQALTRIAEFYAVEIDIHGRDADARRARVSGRKADPRQPQELAGSPIHHCLAEAAIAGAIRYTLGRWAALPDSLTTAVSRSTPTRSSVPTAPSRSIANTPSHRASTVVANPGRSSRHSSRLANATA